MRRGQSHFRRKKIGTVPKATLGQSPAGDLHLSSAHYACTHCNVSFEPPSPQLFSFNSPQGMCPECGGLGQIYTFDPERLVPDPSRSFQQGCIELLGAWQEMGRWRRHIYRGAAEWLERKHGLEPGTVLETAWEELDPQGAAGLALGHRDRSTSPSPGGAGRRATSGAARSRASSPSCWPSIAAPAAASNAGNWKSTCGSSAARRAAESGSTPRRRPSPWRPPRPSSPRKKS